MVEVRALTSNDTAAVRDLLAELGYPASDGIDRRLEHWATEPHRRLLLAHHDTNRGPDQGPDVLGLVGVTFTPRLESDRWWAQIVALVVDSRARRQGVGRILLEHVEGLATQAGCDAIMINSSRARASAQRFYLQAGYRDRCNDHAQFIRPIPTSS